MNKTVTNGTPAGEALLELCIDVIRTGFRVREAGKATGAVAPWGGGLGGVLNSLKAEGPQTVPQMARARPVARQRIQRIVNELAAEGLVEFTDNPAHRRSKLVRLTGAGEARLEEMMLSLRHATEELARDMNAADLVTAVNVLRQLRETLGAQQRS